jgi:hypothetical protein
MGKDSGERAKKNCWEVMKCGREPGGKYASHFGICLAASDTTHDGVHGGRNAGRACWMVAGTASGRKPEGTFVEKCLECSKCRFYRRVKREEGEDFVALGSKKSGKAAA